MRFDKEPNKRTILRATRTDASLRKKRSLRMKIKLPHYPISAKGN
jgi:hypothetical protein